ncbi:MAG: nitroreductase family protein [Promethearchaeota archaeon]|nr:MAG: nitroreductase family protein [Candidatus Lokiarchaeota archaeon]
MENDSKKFLDFVKSRRSIRNFIFSKIYKDTILEILEFGRWAPSGMNNQPWRVHIVMHEKVKTMLAECTKYGNIIESAYVNLVIFLDLEKGYNRVKDIQAIGAFMQNILLGVHAQPDLGAVWIGEILNQSEKVNEIFKLDSKKFELMGVICIGEVDQAIEQRAGKTRERRPIDDFVDWY